MGVRRGRAGSLDRGRSPVRVSGGHGQDKTKARVLSEPSLLPQKLPMVSRRREQRVTVFPWRLLRQPHSTASPKQSLLGRTLVKEPWLWTPPPFHFSLVMPRVRCP